MNNDLLTIDDICKELGIGKNSAYKLIHSNTLAHGRIGSKIVVHRNELMRYIMSTTHSNDN